MAPKTVRAINMTAHIKMRINMGKYDRYSTTIKKVIADHTPIIAI